MKSEKKPEGRRLGRFCLGLRCKTIIILAATIMIATVGTVLAARYYFEGSIDRIEIREAEQALGRVWAHILDDLEQLDTIAGDWAARDDMWDYVKTKKPGFEQSNFRSGNVLQTLKSSALIIVDARGGVVYETALNPTWLPGLRQCISTMRSSDTTNWLHLSEANGSLHIAAARPIVKSDGTGEQRGTFILARIIDKALLERYSRIIGVPVDIRLARAADMAQAPADMIPPPPGTALPPVLFEPNFHGPPPGRIKISIDRGVINADMRVPLPASHDQAEIRVSLPRNLDRFGGLGPIMFLTAIILLSALIGMGSIFLFETAVLGRMRIMVAKLERITVEGDTGLRLSEKGNDELAILGRTVNATLDRFSNLLDERDAAIREIHHRVKNNLQIISSLVSLQAGKAGSKESSSLFDIRRRVLAISFVHEELYLDREIERVDAERLISRLASMVSDTYDTGARIRIEVECEKLYLNLEQAVPIGLIVSEIAANSFCHAYPNDESGVLRISARLDIENSLRLSIDDDGIGIKEDHGKGLGLSLVETLALQIQAVYELRKRPEGGTSFLIVAPGSIAS